MGGGITRTFRPWTHTSDDSYIYQLSLVVATATVSFYVFERSEFPIPTWVIPQYWAPSPPKNLCVCSTNLGFSGGSANRYCCRTLRQYDTRYVIRTRYVLILCTTLYETRYVRIMYQIHMIPAQETAVSLFVCSLVGGGITRTFRPWTHTSDDSYIYQLSLVVATATVSYQVLTGIPRRHSP